MIGRRSSDDAQSFEEAWNGRTPRDEHIADLVAFAEGLCEAAVVEPSMQFRTDLRAQLMTEAATILVPMPGASRRPVAAPVRETRSGRRRVAGLTAALIASAGAVSMVASSASAVPGEMLYPVKRGMENVELALHRDDASRGQFQLARASERLAEATTLAAGDGSSQQRVADLLDDFTTTATDAWVSMDEAFAADASTATMQRVSTFAQSAAQELTALRSALPAGSNPSFSDATDVVVAMTTGVAERCTSCGPVDLGQLVNAVTDVAQTTPADRTPAQDTGTSKPAGSKSSGSSDSTTGSGGSASQPTQTPTTTPTTTPPAVPVKTPSLSDVTDPLLGGLLGDDEQVGLVPGLLNGLLGGGK